MLNPEQGAAFIRVLIKQPTLIRVCRVVEMIAPIRKINKIGFGSRILRAATSAIALTATGSNGTALDGRAKPDDHARSSSRPRSRSRKCASPTT